MDDVIQCRCGQSFTIAHERCPYCANPIQRFWYHALGNPRSAISTRIDGKAVYITEHGPLAASNRKLPAALKRANATRDAMQSVTGTRTGPIRSELEFLATMAAENLPLPLIVGIAGIAASLAVFAPLRDILERSWASQFVEPLLASMVVTVFLIGLTILLVIWSGTFGTSFSVNRLARSNQPSGWDDWLR